MVSWLNRAVLVSIRSYLIVLAISNSTWAQDADSAGLGDSIDSAEQLATQGRDSLTEKYEDVAREYGGFRRSPILFGTNTSGGSAHPGMSMFGLDIGTNPKNWERAGNSTWGVTGIAKPLDLSVDDEISKSSMAPFQNTVSNGGTKTIQESFLQNESERDTFLDSFKTARSIAIMTLSYLDKTVAAGLATSQSQADSDTIHQLLKEMNKSMSKIARPDRARVFDDQDEKFEICMQGVLSANTPSAEKVALQGGAQKPFAFVWDPYVQCELDRKPPSKFCGGPPAYASSRYHFCSCCAESNETVNRSTIVPADADASRKRTQVSTEGFSLVDRVYMGATIPFGQVRFDSSVEGASNGAPYNAGNALVDFAAMARALYGDVLFTPKFGIPTPGNTDTAPRSKTPMDKPRLTIKTAAPLLSVQQWIKAIRDFSELKKFQPYTRVLDTFSTSGGSASDAGLSCTWENNEGMWLRYCPSFGGSIRWGIEPALRQLIKLEKENTLNDYAKDTAATYTSGTTQYQKANGTPFKRSEAILQMWAEASLGGVMLSRADLTTMAELEGTSDGERIIEAFCDTSAVEAIKKLHRKMVTLSNDLMATNRKATTSEKNDLSALIKRVDDQLKGGTEDSRSKVDELLLALDMQRDRKREALRSSLVATGHASRRQGNKGGLRFTNFGSPYIN